MKPFSIITNLLSILIFISTNALATQIPIKALQRCCNQKNCIEYAIKNAELFVVTGNEQLFLYTDSNGFFYLDDTFANKASIAYLATDEKTIFAGCYSDMTRSNSNKIVLSGLCPVQNCKLT